METRSNKEEAGKPGNPATPQSIQHPGSMDSRSRKAHRSRADTKDAAPTQSAQPDAPNMTPDRGMMHKGVYLSVLIYVEGYQAPAGDFNELTTSVLRKNLGEYFAEPHDGLTMTLKSVNVKNNVEDEGEKFQF